MKKIIFLSLIILFSIKTQNIYSKTNTFAVDNIEVVGDFVGQNDYSRQKYLNIGFKKGFKNLVINLLKKEDQKKILSTELKVIKSLIENYSIKEEIKQNNKYILKLNINFNKQRTKQFLYERNIPYSVSKELEIILYPILIKESEVQVFSQNKFFDEWNETNDVEDIKFLLAVENIEDLNFIKKNIEILEEIPLVKLVDDYETKNSAIVILRYNNNKLSTFLKTNLNGIKKLNKVEFNIENLDNKEVRKDIITSIKFYIKELWKEENLIDISAPASLTFVSKLKDASSIAKITSKLENINFIQSFSIQELTNNSAKIKITYLGKIKNIQDSFARNGFKLEIYQDGWFLSL